MPAEALLLSAWSAALQVADELVRQRSVRALAVTGSLARGDFCAGSDVDLWLIGSRNRRVERLVNGVSVSLLSCTPRRARSLEGLLRFEVDDAAVLHDPDGILAELKRTSRARREELRGHMLRASALPMTWLARKATEAKPPLAIAALRELARRGAALSLHDRYGWRVPRSRHFRSGLPASASALLFRTLALPAEPHWRAKLIAARRGRPPVPELPFADEAHIERYLANGRAGDAVLSLRQSLPPAPRAVTMTRPQHALFRALHGFDAAAGPRRAQVSALAADVLELLDRVRALELLSAWRADVQGPLAASAQRMR